MKNALIKSIALLLLLGIAIGMGFTIDKICDAIDRRTHPRTYADYVERYAALYHVPESVVYATILCESDFKSNAVSKAGAVGLMQLMPSTFSWLCEKLGDTFAEGMLYDPETNIRYGTYYLSYLYDAFGRWETVYAAYNCGPGKVKEWLKNEDYADENGVLTQIPFRETRSYVKKVAKAAALYQTLYE